MPREVKRTARREVEIDGVLWRFELAGDGSLTVRHNYCRKGFTWKPRELVAKSEQLKSGNLW